MNPAPPLSAETAPAPGRIRESDRGRSRSQINLRLIAALAGSFAFALPASAVTATGLASFEAIEEPLVVYTPATGTFTPDPFINITAPAPGTFRFAARYTAARWDADRDTTNTDRQRAEVKGLGPHQRDGEDYEYAFTWRANPGFRGSNGFCHLFQLKAIHGDSGMPLVTLSIRGDQASVEGNPGGAPKVVARRFPWRPDTWQTVRLRVRTSPRAEGELLVSVDGDAFQGKTGIVLARPGADTYRPKWGLYRKADTQSPIGDDWVEHKAVSAVRRDPGAPPEDAEAIAAATHAAELAERDPAAAVSRAEQLPAGPARRDARLRVFSRWADRDVAAAAAWLHARAPDPELDLLAWFFVTDTTYRYVDRPVALAAAPLLHDPALRADAFYHVLEIWARQDRAAAIAFAEKTPALTAEQKAALIARLPNR